MNTPETDLRTVQGLRFKKGAVRLQKTFSLSICPAAERALNKAIDLLTPMIRRPSKTLITRRALQIYFRYLTANLSRSEILNEEVAALTDLAKTGKLKH